MYYCILLQLNYCHIFEYILTYFSGEYRTKTQGTEFKCLLTETAVLRRRAYYTLLHIMTKNIFILSLANLRGMQGNLKKKE